MQLRKLGKNYDETAEAECSCSESTTKYSIEEAVEISFENDVAADELFLCLTFYERYEKEKEEKAKE